MNSHSFAAVNAYDEKIFFDSETMSPFHRLASLIISTVAPVFKLSREDLVSGSRGTAQAALARQVAMYLARVIGGLQLTQIGDAFGRDRTTVAHACAVVEDRRDNPEFDRIVDLLERIVARLRHISTAHLPPSLTI